uniref:Uncharacterized protein n=1 Tax=Tanacetum cinerariifolium TaxID=118510 RepID=A0A6L2L839_TANCI|nr:hypothetical protein [Tanacetum cinerariifolium]
MATPIDFSKFANNHLKLDKITKADLVGQVCNLLKGTYQSNIVLEYNMEKCYRALSDRLNRETPEGDRCPFNLTKPLPLKGHPDSECGKCEDQQMAWLCYLEEIMKRRADKKLFHLDGDVIVDLVMALRIFTESLIIKKRVKDVQLGVESY